MRSDLLRLLAEQPCELAFVRRQHTRRGPLPGLELEERVCIDDGGQLASASTRRTTSVGPAPRPSPGPIAIAPAFCSKLERDVRGGRSDDAVGFG